MAAARGSKKRRAGNTAAKGAACPVCPAASVAVSEKVTGRLAQGCLEKSSISFSVNSARSPVIGIGRGTVIGSHDYGAAARQ